MHVDIVARIPAANQDVYLEMTRKLKVEESKNPKFCLKELYSKAGIESMDRRFFCAVIKAVDKCNGNEKGRGSSVRGLEFSGDIAISVANFAGIWESLVVPQLDESMVFALANGQPGRQMADGGFLMLPMKKDNDSWVSFACADPDLEFNSRYPQKKLTFFAAQRQHKLVLKNLFIAHLCAFQRLRNIEQSNQTLDEDAANWYRRILIGAFSRDPLQHTCHNKGDCCPDHLRPGRPMGENMSEGNDCLRHDCTHELKCDKTCTVPGCLGCYKDVSPDCICSNAEMRMCIARYFNGNRLASATVKFSDLCDNNFKVEFMDKFVAGYLPSVRYWHERKYFCIHKTFHSNFDT